MEKYLDKKGVKFEDERLNCAINITSLAKGGREKMDFLIDNLTSEAIRIIDSKQNVISVPIKNGYMLRATWTK